MPCLAQDDGAKLAAAFASEVDKRLSLPDDEQHTYADLLTKNLSNRNLSTAQYTLIVDRNNFVQAGMIYWMSMDRVFHFVGAFPVSTGKPGTYEHFVTPTGAFEHTVDNPDFRSRGTRNKLGIRGFGEKGSRVYDFGWQDAVRGWGRGGPGKLRLEMHATDPDRLAKKLGTPQSEGCIRIPASLNLFIDHRGVLDGDYNDAISTGKTFWVLPKTRETTPSSGRFLVIVDTGRTERPVWSPLPPEQ